jgi:hypothetical protein
MDNILFIIRKNDWRNQIKYIKESDFDESTMKLVEVDKEELKKISEVFSRDDSRIKVHMNGDVKTRFSFVKREEFNPLTPEIAFRCRLDKKEPMDCMTTIVRCVRELDQQFIRSKKLRFVYRQSSSTKDEWEDLLERCTEHINEMWQHRYGLG